MYLVYLYEVLDIVLLEQVVGIDKDVEKVYFIVEEVSIESVDWLEQFFFDINVLVDGLKLYKNLILMLSELVKQFNINEIYILQAIN